MIQEVIAYLIIIAAFGIFIHNVLSFFNLTGKKQAKSAKCSGCSSGCEMKELHLLNKGMVKKPDQYRFYL